LNDGEKNLPQVAVAACFLRSDFEPEFIVIFFLQTINCPFSTMYISTYELNCVGDFFKRGKVKPSFLCSL
jgi:hypothetical protein